MDMKKILQAFDGAAEKKPVQGANDMKKFLSIVKESTNPYTPAQESVITSFEEGSVGGDANAFLLAADTIQDEVMAQVNKIKINADEASLRDMMDKFNSFMTAYHNVGKGILQPDMFNDEMGESVEEGRHGYDDSGMSLSPGNDEGPDSWDYSAAHDRIGAGDPRPKRSAYQAPQEKPQMVGMFFYNVQPGQENEAAALGIKKTKSGKWAKTKYNTSGRTFGMQKDQADKAFGVGKWWAPKTESIQSVAEQGVAEGSLNEGQYEMMMRNGQVKKFIAKDDADAKRIAAGHGAKSVIKLRGGVPAGKVAEMDKSQTPPGRDGSNSDSDAGKKEYYGKSVKAKDVVKSATKSLDKEMKKAHAKEGLSFKDYVNLAEAKKGLA